jgi:hypothetical protein
MNPNRAVPPEENRSRIIVRHRPGAATRLRRRLIEHADRVSREHKGIGALAVEHHFAWSSHTLWGAHIRWGDNILADSSLVRYEFPVWSSRLVWCDEDEHILWGDHDHILRGDVDHILWVDSSGGADTTAP